MTTAEQICIEQSETIEKQASLIVSLLREVMQHRELDSEEKRILENGGNAEYDWRLDRF